MAEPLLLVSRDLTFAELDELRLYLERVLERSSISLMEYCDEISGGFFHLRSGSNPGDFSKASSATCVAFLVEAGLWGQAKMPWADKALTLGRAILRDEKWDSADLPPNNFFTTSFLLEALIELRRVESRLPGLDNERISRHLEQFRMELRRGDGIAIEGYPPTAFVTHKVVRVLQRWGRLDRRTAKSVAEWVWPRIHEESVAVASKRPDSDVFDLAYAVLIASLVQSLADMTPRQRATLEHALDQFFAAQNEDGSWPRSQPLFHYPRLGNAYCYDYEFLVQLLSDRQLQDLLYGRLAPLRRAALALDTSKIPLGELGQLGWATGHLRQTIADPESWSTASVFHYCFLLRQIVAEGVRRSLFDYAGARYSVPTERLGEIDVEEFLDCPVDIPQSATPRSLTIILNENLIAPLVAEADNIPRGQPFSKETPTSAILYGPPGTSKTQLAELIARALGWPLLKLDPSHLTRDGLDRLHAETHRVFTMLAATERIVVLLDEFDELVLARTEPDVESSSRFLTTAMLPKIAALAGRRRIVYLLATNHIERFDDAISRPGRFDLVLPVMPPTLDAKLRAWPTINEKLTRLGIRGANMPEDVSEGLADLTFLEFRAIAGQVARARTQTQLERIVRDAASRCTMRQKLSVDDHALTWKEELRSDEVLARTRAGGTS